MSVLLLAVIAVAVVIGWAVLGLAVWVGLCTFFERRHARRLARLPVESDGQTLGPAFDWYHENGRGVA